MTGVLFQDEPGHPKNPERFLGEQAAEIRLLELVHETGRFQRLHGLPDLLVEVALVRRDLLGEGGDVGEGLLHSVRHDGVLVRQQKSAHGQLDEIDETRKPVRTNLVITSTLGFGFSNRVTSVI